MRETLEEIVWSYWETRIIYHERIIYPGILQRIELELNKQGIYFDGVPSWFLHECCINYSSSRKMSFVDYVKRELYNHYGVGGRDEKTITKTDTT